MHNTQAEANRLSEILKTLTRASKKSGNDIDQAD